MARKQYSTSLDDKLLLELKLQAVRQGKAVNGILEEIIKEWLEKQS